MKEQMHTEHRESPPVGGRQCLEPAAASSRRRLPDATDTNRQTIFGADIEEAYPTLSWSRQYELIHAEVCAREEVVHFVPDIPEHVVDEALADVVVARQQGSAHQLRAVARRLTTLCWGRQVLRPQVDALYRHLHAYAAVAAAATPTTTAVELRQSPRPPLREALRAVIGLDKLSINEAMTRLAMRGWTPRSALPRQDIAHQLSHAKDDFQQVQQGVYRVLFRDEEAR
jgi:hypothetical protein